MFQGCLSLNRSHHNITLIIILYTQSCTFIGSLNTLTEFSYIAWPTITRGSMSILLHIPLMTYVHVSNNHLSSLFIICLKVLNYIDNAVTHIQHYQYWYITRSHHSSSCKSSWLARSSIEIGTNADPNYYILT